MWSSVPGAWLPWYRNAEQVLRESLDRYQLADDNDENAIGIKASREPEDFADVRRQRLESEYFLALALREINREAQMPDESGVRRHLSRVIDSSIFPNSMFAAPPDQTLLLRGDTLLGVTSGPVIRPRYLETLRRNAFFLLAQSWKELGRECERATPARPDEARAAYEEALKVYRLARDRLPPQDGPEILYNIGDTLFDLGRHEDAGRMFLMVISQVTQMESVEDRPEFTDEIRIWRTLSENRMKDLENVMRR